MRLTATVCVILYSATLWSAPDITKDLKDDKQREMEQLKGAWKVTGFEVPGLGDGVQPNTENMELVFSEKEITSSRNGMQEPNGTMKYTIDPTKKPKHLDLERADKDQPGPQAVQGIYDLKDDKLVICFQLSPSDEKKIRRPASFDDKGEDGFLLIKITLERKKK